MKHERLQHSINTKKHLASTPDAQTKSPTLTTLQLGLGTVAILIATSLLWRKASRHRSIPLPARLSALVNSDNPLAPTHHAKNVIRNANITAGMRVLDAGCGPGRLTLPIAKSVGETGGVTALDIQPEMLQKVKDAADASDITNIEYLPHGLGDTPLPHRHFDRVVMASVLGEIPEEKKADAIQSAHDSLKENGTLSINEILFDPHYQTEAATRATITPAGFNLTSTHRDTLFGITYAQHQNFEKTTSSAKPIKP